MNAEHQSSLGAPSEQLSGIVARWEHDVADRRFALETGTSGGRTASVPLWEFDLIVAALPGLLARARDGERWRFLRDHWPDVQLAWLEVETGKFDGAEPIYVRTASVAQESTGISWEGDTAEEAVDAAMSGLAAAARSTGSANDE